jgi:glycerol kinase
MEWSTIVSNLVGIPLHILPEIRDTSGDFGATAPAIFGAAIPITAMVIITSGLNVSNITWLMLR